MSIHIHEKSNGIISANAVSKHFGPVQALDKVSFSVQKGQVFGFLGPNGAGKTTTIRCLMDYIRPDSGSITVVGKDAKADSTDLKNSIGFLSSEMQLYEHWTGQDHLNLFQSVKGKNGNAEALTKRLGLNLKTKVKNLSSGNKQKLAVVLAFCGSPKLMVMDEPTRGLDPLLQNELYDIIREFRNEGGAVFLSSHNLPEVQRICDMVAVIKAGRVIAEKTMDDIRDMHTHIIRASIEGKVAASDVKIKGVEVTHYHNGEIILKVRGDINSIIGHLAKYKLKDIEINHANLEDIFMEFYR